jgi:hypothetical protein
LDYTPRHARRTPPEETVLGRFHVKRDTWLLVGGAVVALLVGLGLVSLIVFLAVTP